MDVAAYSWKSFSMESDRCDLCGVGHSMGTVCVWCGHGEGTVKGYCGNDEEMVRERSEDDKGTVRARQDGRAHGVGTVWAR